MNARAGKSDRAMKIYAFWTKAANCLQSPFLLLIRLYWGWQFFETGFGKLHHVSHVIQFFQSLQIPLPGLNAWIVSIVEAVGGLMFLLGLAGRLAAAALAFDMVVAYVTADRDALSAIFSNPDNFVQATPFPFLLVTLTVLAFGSGMFSADRLIGRYFLRKNADKPSLN